MFDYSMSYIFFFFFQAEDGIRDLTVTGVQTCALPIYTPAQNSPRTFNDRPQQGAGSNRPTNAPAQHTARDRKSTRLNSSHSQISYAVFCLKKKNKRLTMNTECYTP